MVRHKRGWISCPLSILIETNLGERSSTSTKVCCQVLSYVAGPQDILVNGIESCWGQREPGWLHYPPSCSRQRSFTCVINVISVSIAGPEIRLKRWTLFSEVLLDLHLAWGCYLGAHFLFPINSIGAMIQVGIVIEDGEWSLFASSQRLNLSYPFFTYLDFLKTNLTHYCQLCQLCV